MWFRRFFVRFSAAYCPFVFSISLPLFFHRVISLSQGDDSCPSDRRSAINCVQRRREKRRRAECSGRRLLRITFRQFDGRGCGGRPLVSSFKTDGRGQHYRLKPRRALVAGWSHRFFLSGRRIPETQGDIWWAAGKQQMRRGHCGTVIAVAFLSASLRRSSHLSLTSLSATRERPTDISKSSNWWRIQTCSERGPTGGQILNIVTAWSESRNTLYFATDICCLLLCCMFTAGSSKSQNNLQPPANKYAVSAVDCTLYPERALRYLANRSLHFTGGWQVQNFDFFFDCSRQSKCNIFHKSKINLLRKTIAPTNSQIS